MDDKRVEIGDGVRRLLKQSDLTEEEIKEVVLNHDFTEGKEPRIFLEGLTANGKRIIVECHISKAVWHVVYAYQA